MNCSCSWLRFVPALRNTRGGPSFMISPTPIAAAKGLLRLFLQETVGVDVDNQANVAPGLRHGAKPEPQIGLEVDFAGGLDQEAVAVAAADHRKRRLGRTQYLDLGCRRGGKRHGARVNFDRLARAAAHEQ